jgi:hypothetical protein
VLRAGWGFENYLSAIPYSSLRRARLLLRLRGSRRPTRILAEIVSVPQMIWPLKLLGYRNRKYRGVDFSVRINPEVREGLSVIYTRKGATLRLRGERIGRNWEGIEVHIPQEVEVTEMSHLVGDLETAFRAMKYAYVIARKAPAEPVSETDRQAAIVELREMGFDIEVSADGTIRQTRGSGGPRGDHDIETLRETSPRIVFLLQSAHGTRSRLEILARSKQS